MALILNIETATKVCSVCLSQHGKVLESKELKSEKFSHSENLNLFIESIFENSEYNLEDVDAISVSKGPGSYTGLRIGVSTAKGLCYALDKPLISVNSLTAMTSLTSFDFEYIVPMFDARRMEVYSAVYNDQLEMVEEVRACVLDENSYDDFLEKGKTVFLGPGAEKYKSIMSHKNASFDLTTEVSAVGMIPIAEQKFENQEFEDVAYFEPFYLKEFIAGTPKKMF